ncbi:MAG TPA: hypothetical protein VGM91_21660 [Conexibacter sp.]
MQLRPHRIAKRPRTARSQGTTTEAAPTPLLFAAQLEPPSRERDAGGPEDRARYYCHCGFVFDASVSASVSCPHCGSPQAW